MTKVGIVKAERPTLAQAANSFHSQIVFRQIWFLSTCPTRCWRRRSWKLLAHYQTGKDDKARLACSITAMASIEKLEQTTHRLVLPFWHYLAHYFVVQAASGHGVGVARRELVLCSAQWLWCGALLTGTDDAKTIVNSVLGKLSRETAMLCASTCDDSRSTHVACHVVLCKAAKGPKY